MKTSVQEFIDIAEELNARIASHTIGLPWFGDLWPFAVKLADCWKLIADELPDENRIPPFVLAEVWNGCEAKLTSQLPPDYSFERFQELLQPNSGQWGRQQWMTFVLLRDTDGTIWNPLPAMHSSESKGFAAIVPTAEMSLIPSEFTRAQAVSILEKWIRHVLRMEGNLKAEPAARKPIESETELVKAQPPKIVVPTNEDVSRVVNLVAEGMPVQTAAKKVAENSHHSWGSLKVMYYKHKKKCVK